MTSSISSLYLRDLEKLLKEIELFQDEQNLWKTSGSLKNTSGTLVLHITGNLQHFIGTILGNTEYKRDREFEFSGTPVSKDRLIMEIAAASKLIESIIPTLSPEDLNETFPVDVFHDNASVEKFLIHLYGHLNWHLGQINYLRRVLEE